MEAGTSSRNAGQLLELRVWNKNYGPEISVGKRDRKWDLESKTQASKNKLVKLLDERLRLLEEDDESFKKEFMKIAKERSDLISEVREYFEDIHCICNLYRKSGEIYSYGALAIESHKKERTGLLQVLFEESNPSLLTRGQGAEAAVIQYQA